MMWDFGRQLALGLHYDKKDGHVSQNTDQDVVGGGAVGLPCPS